MSNRSRILGRFPQPAQKELTIIDRTASALEQLLRSNTTHWEVLTATDFTGDGNVKIFIKQLQKVANANDWSKMATLLHILTHLKHHARECEIHATLKEVLE